MSTTAFEKRIWNGRIAAVCAVTLLIGLLAAASPARGQQDLRPTMPLPVNLGSPSSCPQPASMPTVPLQSPRPGEGPAAEQIWRRTPEPASGPVASVVESLKGNDAVIEVIVGQSRLLTLKAFQAVQEGDELRTTDIVVADESVVECDWVKNRAAVPKQGFAEAIVPKDNQKLLRVKGLRPGVTDLSITTPDDQTYAFEVHVLYDLDLFGLQLKQAFPNARLHLFQIREHLAVEGEARSIRQVDQILQTIEAYLKSVDPSNKAQAQAEASYEHTGQASGQASSERGRTAAGDERAVKTVPEGEAGTSKESRPGRPQGADQVAGRAAVEERGKAESKVDAGGGVSPQIINLLRVPGVQQVMLQVRIAELNRTGLRQIGADMNLEFGPGNVLDTFLGNTGFQTVSGVFPTTDLTVLLRALRENSLLSILAEPNLVTLSGQKATFLAGGEIPIPISTITAGSTNISIEWREYGVTLEFEPYVLEDETVRLTVTPEESALDWVNGIQVEGIDIPATTNRRASTTVEMRQGQSLAIAGLLRVSIDANTRRIPGLGDLPYIGPMFSNTSHQRTEKELVILVTPYLVAPMNAENVPCLPGEELKDPNDWEFYLLNRIEGRTGREWSSAREWDDPWHLRRLMHLEQSGISGPVGFSPCE